MKLATKLTALFLLLSIVPMAVVGFLAFESGRRSIERDVRNKLTSTNSLRAAEFDRWIQNTAGRLRELARRPGLREQAVALMSGPGLGPEYRSAHGVLIEGHLGPTIEEEGGFLELFVLRPEDGVIIASTDTNQEGKLRESEPYFTEGKGRTHVQNVHYSQTLEAPAMTIGTPVNGRDGSLIAVLAGHVDLAEMSEIMLTGAGLSATEESYLVNNFNFFVTEPRFGEGFALKKAIRTDGVKACLQGNEGIGFYDNYAGIKVIGAYRWIPQRQLCILTEVQHAEAFAPIADLRNFVFGIAAAVALIGALSGVFFARTVTGPVRQLVRGAEEIGRGNLDHRIKVGAKDEIGQLSRSFGQMTKNLKAITASRDELDKEITDRKRAEERLRESEERYRTIVDLSPDAIHVVQEGKYVYVNSAGAKLFGAASGEELVGRPVMDFVHPDYRAQMLERFRQVQEQGQRVNPMEVKALRVDGQVIEVEGLGAPIVYQGKPAVQVVVRDITQRKRADEKLRQSEERYRSLFQDSRDAVYVSLRAGGFVDVNSSMVEMFGYSREELLHREGEKLYADPADRSSVLRRLESAGSVKDLNVKFRKKDGTEIDCLVTASVRRGNDGNVQGYQGIIRDITDRKRAQEMLLESEERFHTIFERSNDPIFVIDPERDEILDVNSTACTMMGYSHHELTSIPLSAMHPKQMAQLQAFVQLVMEEGHGWTDELTCTTKNGRVVLAEISASAADIQGKRRMICMVRDITERRQAEQRMREESRLLSMGELVAEVAHELNNPLTAVLGFAQILDAQDLEAPMKEDVGHIINEARRTAEVVQNLLSFARKRAPKIECFDMATTVERSLAMKAHDLRVDNIETETQFKSGPLYVMADQHRLQEVFLNVVTNAQYAMTEAHGGGRLVIDGTKRGDVVMVSFADNGPGIPPEQLQHIFDPFFTSKEEGKGTGLGLSICRNLINDQGGRIWAESEIGKGATFHVELPAGEHPQ